jgi:hypothetical protein
VFNFLVSTEEGKDLLGLVDVPLDGSHAYAQQVRKFSGVKWSLVRPSPASLLNQEDEESEAGGLVHTFSFQ